MTKSTVSLCIRNFLARYPRTATHCTEGTLLSAEDTRGTPCLHSPSLTAGAGHRGHTGHTVRASLVSPAQYLRPWAAAHQPTADKGNSPGPGLRVPSAPNQRGCACLPDLPACPFPKPACHSMSSRIKKNLKLLKYQCTLDLLPF